jgi:DNA-directed RNA polymerase subunit RPC12/RpoP
MPEHDYRCEKCAIVWASYQPLDHEHDERCRRCGKKAIIWWSRPIATKPDRGGYFSHALGKFVKSRAHLNELLAEAGRQRAIEQPWLNDDRPFVLVDGDLPAPGQPIPETPKGEAGAGDMPAFSDDPGAV